MNCKHNWVEVFAALNNKKRGYQFGCTRCQDWRFVTLIGVTP